MKTLKISHSKGQVTNYGKSHKRQSEHSKTLNDLSMNTKWGETVMDNHVEEAIIIPMNPRGDYAGGSTPGSIIAQQWFAEKKGKVFWMSL